MNNDTEMLQLAEEETDRAEAIRRQIRLLQDTSEAGRSNATFATLGPVHDDIPGWVESVSFQHSTLSFATEEFYGSGSSSLLGASFC